MAMRRNGYVAMKARAYVHWVKALLRAEDCKPGSAEHASALADAARWEKAYRAAEVSDAAVKDLSSMKRLDGLTTKESAAIPPTPSVPRHPTDTVASAPHSAPLQSPSGTPMGAAHRDTAAPLAADVAAGRGVASVPWRRPGGEGVGGPRPACTHRGGHSEEDCQEGTLPPGGEEGDGVDE